MPKAMNAIDAFAVALAKLMIRLRYLVIVLCVGLAGWLVAFASNMTMGTDYRVYFSSENPELTAFENFQATFTKFDNVLFVLKPKSGDAFDRDTLIAVEKLTTAGWEFPFASRVDSVVNFQSTRAEGDELIVEDLVKDPANRSAEELAQRKRIALAEPLIVNQLLSPDGRLTAVSVVQSLPGKSADEVPKSLAAARALRDRLEAEHPGLEVRLTGGTAMNGAFSEAAEKDMTTLMPLMFFVVLTLALISLRSLSGALVCFAIIVPSVMVCLGAGGLMHVQLTPVSLSAPIIVMTLAVADAIHILISMRAAMRAGLEKRPALIESMRINFVAVSITSLTTIVGFLSLNFSDSPPFGHLGNMSAAGVLAAWFFSITLLPALVSLLPFKAAGANADRGDRAMLGLADFVIRRPRTVFVSMTAAILGLTFMITQIENNDAFVEYFHESLEFRQDADEIAKDFGVYPLEFAVRSSEPGGVADPEFLARVEKFADWLREQPKVQHVYSFTDIIKRLNKNMHGDDESYYRLPEDRELAAQYLLLYELSLPLGLDLNDRIDIEKAITRVTASMAPVTTRETKDLLDRAEAYVAENFAASEGATPTSVFVMFTFISDRNIESMISGTILAILLISLIMALATSSIALGSLSILTNGLPILGTFGVWAVFVGEVGFTVAIVSTISLGIIIDDTVHFLTKYRRARREDGKSVEDAIRYAFQTVGMALVVNTFILVLGFLVLALSTFKPMVDMGIMTMSAILLALIIDFLLLPALLLLVARHRSAAPATQPVSP